MKKKSKKPQLEKEIEDKSLLYEGLISQSLYLNAFELFIYDNSENMNLGIKDWLRKNKFSTKDDNSEFAGVVLEHNKEVLQKGESGEEYRIFAAMFLSAEDLTVGIVAHECLHAAMVLEKNIFRFVGLYEGNDNTGNSPEERLAYNINEFVDEIIDVLLKKKIKLKNGISTNEKSN